MGSISRLTRGTGAMPAFCQACEEELYFRAGVSVRSLLLKSSEGQNLATRQQIPSFLIIIRVSGLASRGERIVEGWRVRLDV